MSHLGEEQDHANEEIRKLSERVEQLVFNMEKARFAEYVQLLEKPGKLLWSHLLGGIARGVGIAIGFTLLTSTLLYFLRVLGALDLPIIGDYIAEIVKHVQAQLEGRTY